MSNKVNNIDYERINESLKNVDLIGLDWDYIGSSTDQVKESIRSVDWTGIDD